ncbi:MAG: alpha/beta hydrolase [Eubacteriaceae bacterium]|nr:alpha/beta hydrolase [Eubacteriaceae bacterium]
MKFVEYGIDNEDVIILLHGGGLNVWNYEESAEILKDRFHVILPVLDGHAGSDDDFTGIGDNAKRITDYIDKNHSGKVLLIGGVSLGGQIALEILSLRPDICRYAIIESALVIPMNLTNLLVKPMLDMSYFLIKQKWFAKLQSGYLKIKKELFDKYFRDTALISKQNMISFLKANSSYSLNDNIINTSAKVYIVAGGKEQKKILRSAELLKDTINGSRLVIKDKLYHGEYSLNHPEEFAENILEMTK